MGRQKGARREVFRSLAGNRALVRLVGGYALFVLTEYAVWIAMLVYAYAHGGATVAGLVALAQLVPAAAFAPVAAYGAAVLASTAVTTTRPAQSTLIPSICATPDELTAANVVVSWLEAAGITVAGLLTGLLISLGGPGSVFAAGAGVILAAAALVASLRVTALTPPGQQAAVLADLGEAVRLAGRRPRLRLMLALLTAEAAVVGALDLLFVILAVSVLGRSQAWAGYLNSAYGLGAVLAATVSALLVGRRLGAPILAA